MGVVGDRLGPVLRSIRGTRSQVAVAAAAGGLARQLLDRLEKGGDRRFLDRLETVAIALDRQLVVLLLEGGQVPAQVLDAPRWLRHVIRAAPGLAPDQGELVGLLAAALPRMSSSLEALLRIEIEAIARGEIDQLDAALAGDLSPERPIHPEK